MANDGPNIIMSQGDSILSSLTVPNPAIIVKAENPDAVSKAPFVEALDNVLLRELKLREEVDTAALHAYLFGVGIIKIGFDSEYGYDPKLDVGGALKLGFTLTQFSRKGKRRIETDSGVAPGMPWVKATDPRDVVVPWGTHRLSNTPWVAHRFVRQIDDLRSDPKYSHTRRIEPSLSMEDFVSSYKSTMRIWRPQSATTKHSGRLTRRFRSADRGSREIEFVELYEIHDRRTGRIMVIAPDYDSFLRNDFNALQIDNVLPFAAISFTPKSRAFWTTSDAYYLQNVQMEISDLAVQRTKTRRISVLKFLYDEGVINEEELQKILSPDVGVAAKIEAGGDLSKAVMPMNVHPDQTMTLEEEHLRRNAREQSGFSRNQLGEFTGGRKTATEARVVDRAAALRMSRRGLAIKRLYEDTISVINAIVFEHWTAPRYVEIMGQQKGKEWQQITGPPLKSRYSYEINFTDDEEVRQRRIEALQLYMVLSQDPSVNPAGLRQYISDQYDDPAFARIFNADIQNAMRLVRLAGGLVDPTSLDGGGGAGALQAGGAGQAGGTAAPSVLSVSNPNGQGGSPGGQGAPVARGGTTS
jgi:hypothetical protein